MVRDVQRGALWGWVCVWGGGEQKDGAREMGAKGKGVKDEDGAGG